MESSIPSINFSSEDIAIYLQQYSRIILSIIILSNFILIFLLKFKIRKNEKYEIIKNDIINSKQIVLQKNQINQINHINQYQNKEKDNSESNTIQSNINKYILLIIAHPDGETMFFSPTLFSIKEIKSSLEKKGINLKLHILCLSNGNFYGKGKIREKEFENVMLHMKIDKYKLINDEIRFPDKDLYYKSSDVEYEIEKYIKNESEDELSLIFSFDENGVTKHKNHISCYEGLVSYMKKNKKMLMNSKVQVYLLDSYGFVFQYFLQLLCFIWFFIKPYGFIGVYFRRVYKIMSLYQSQFFWWRKAHVLFSIYSCFNTFTKIEFVDDDQDNVKEGFSNEKEKEKNQ